MANLLSGTATWFRNDVHGRKITVFRPKEGIFLSDRE